MTDRSRGPTTDGESDGQHWHLWRFVGWRMMPGHWEVQIGCHDCDAHRQVDIDAETLAEMQYARDVDSIARLASSEQPVGGERE